MLRKLSVSVGLVLMASMVAADTPGRHPRYLHARTDLRIAQNLLRVDEEPNVKRELRVVAEDIERAIREIDRAAVLDAKDLEDHPHHDADLDRPGRFRKAMALLDAARADIGREEDNPRAIGWRNAAYRHIDYAKEHLRRAARNLRMDRELGF